MSIELFEAATTYARNAMTDLTADELMLPTPCDDWLVARVVLHLADVSDALVGLATTGELSMPVPARVQDTDPVAVTCAAFDVLLATLSTTGDAERVEAAAQAGAVEFTMHGWDIGGAREPQHTMPATLATEVLAIASSSLTDDARGTNFAARVPVGSDAPAGHRLAAFLGREPWSGVTTGS